MDSQLIDKILLGNTKEIQDLKNNTELLHAFFDLAKQLNDMPEINTRFYEDSISLYQATSKNVDIKALESVLAGFFGNAVKPSGSKLPFTLKINPSVKYLGGVQKEQSLFIKKLKTGEFYGALWPWKRDPNKIGIHLGYASSRMSDADYNSLGVLLNKTLSKNQMDSFQTDVGGQIHGISLPSFLQMSEMEASTFTLKISRAGDDGRLYLLDGTLINAKTGDLSGTEAAYRIISWESISISIEAVEPDIQKTIHEPLMHLLMESLKIRDEAEAESAPSNLSLEKSDLPEIEPQKPVSRKIKPKKAKASAPPKPPKKKKEKDTTIFFKRPENKAVPQKSGTKWFGKMLVIVLIVGVLSVGGFMAKKILSTKAVALQYTRMIASVDGRKSAEKQYNILKAYIEKNPKSPYKTDVNERMDKTALIIEKNDYEQTILAVNSLSLDETYETKAVAIYSRFLKKHPDSTYVWQINDAIEGIRVLLSTDSYEKLKGVRALDFLNRMKAYKSYMVQFPEGQQQQEVQRLISDLSKEYYQFLESKAADCNKQKNWDECLTHCDNFIAVCSESTHIKNAKALRKKMAGQKDLYRLKESVIMAGKDDSQTRQFYRDHIRANPNSAAKDEIIREIEALDAKISETNEWKQVEHDAMSGVYGINDRAGRLDRYIAKNPSGTYSDKARALRKKIEKEMNQIALKQHRKAQEKKKQEMRQAALETKQREEKRIRLLQAQVEKSLINSGQRFATMGNSTFKDNLTGLTWCLLDSNQALNGCLDYNLAQSYVKTLQTGGYRDWRLPTTSELALLYKNKPFFPDQRVKWYWSSETFSKGFHTVVDIVTSKKETVFERLYRKTDDCGTVRAVRP